MKHSFHIVRRILLRNRILGVSYLIYLVVLIGYGFYQQLNYSTYREISSTLYLGSSEQLLYMTMAAYAFFLYLGYELGVRLHESDIQETLQPQTGTLGNYMGASLLWLVLMAFVGFAVMMGNQLSLFFQESYDNRVLLHMTTANVLYYFLVPVTAGFMGMALARLLGAKRLLVYPIVVGLVLLSSAFFESVMFNIYAANNTDAAAIIPYRIKSWFTFTPYGMSIGIGDDHLYGIPQELGRWLLCLFWMALSSLAIFPRLWGRKIHRWSVRAVCGVMTLLLGLGFASQGYMWEGSGSPLAPDWFIEQIYLRDHPMEEEDGGFVIESYDMELTLFQKLQADVTVKVSQLHEDKDSYTFTLHRFMKIASLTTADGKAIPFERVENVFRFNQSYLPEGGEFRIRYSGSLPTYYCNEQAAALPSWFSYYPMAGVRPIDSGRQSGNNTKLPETKAAFTVKVHAPYAVASNLPGEDQTFAGESQGLSLIGSHLADSHSAMGLTFYSGFQIKKNEITDMMLQLDSWLARANINLGCDPAEPLIVNPREKYQKIFLMPTSFTVNRVRSNFVEQGDHLWLNGYSATEPAAFVSAYLQGVFNQQNNDGWLKNTFVKEITGKEYDPGINISSDPEYWLKKLEDFSNADPEEPVQAELIELVYKNCLEYMREHSDGNVMMRIFERLQTPADQCETDEFIFIRDMMKEVMGNAENQ